MGRSVVSLVLGCAAACTSSDPAGAGGDSGRATTSCAETEILDGATCVPAACGQGPWGDLPVDADTVYVDAGAREGGDGSADAPVPTIQAGLDAAGARGGRLVAVAAGTYPENLALGEAHAGVTLAGRCRDLVTVDGSGDDAPAVTIVGGRTRGRTIGIEGLTVTGGAVGMWIEHVVEVALVDTDVVDNTSLGILAADLVAVDLSGVHVRGTRADRSGRYGRGIEVDAGAVLVARDGEISGNVDVGLLAAGSGSTVELTGVAITDTASSADDVGGRGLSILDGAHLTATDSTVTGNHETGVYVADPGTEVVLVGTRVAGTLPLGDGRYGRGVEVADEATFAATGCEIAENVDIELHVRGSGTAARLTDTRIGLPGSAGARGVDVEEGARLDVVGSTLAGNLDVGVYASGAGTVVALTDTVVTGTIASADRGSGRGVDIQTGARLDAEGCTFEANAEVGVFAGGAGTVVTLVDTVVTGTLPSPDGTGGRGLSCQDGASLLVSGGSVEANREVGVYASGAGSVVSITGAEVRATTPPPAGGSGRGVEVDSGARLAADGLLVEGNDTIGVFVSGAGTMADLVDTHVDATRRGPVNAVALGIAAQEGAACTVEGGAVSRTEGPGVFAVAEGSVTVAGATLTDNSFAGALAADGTLVLISTTIEGTTADAELGGGFGVYTATKGGAVRLDLTGCTIGPHPYAAVWLDGPGRFVLEDDDLSGSAGILLGDWPAHGNAVFAERGVTAWDGASGLLLTGTHLHDAGQIAVLLHGAAATFDADTWTGNTVDVRQQACDGVELLSEASLAGVPDWVRCPGTDVLVDTSVAFTTLGLPEVEPR